MAHIKKIESIFLNEKSITDILLTILSENSDYTKYIQNLIESISCGEEISDDKQV